MRRSLISIAAAVLAVLPVAAAAQVVKVTPLGGQEGEFCALDRAMIFEDSNGTRILYDPGRTVAGPKDPRLGKIDVILVSHMHGDHVGDRHIPRPGAGSCAKPDLSVDDTPETNVVKIAVAKGATIVTGSEMPAFFAAKLKEAGGDPAKSVLARFGSSRTVAGVTVTTVSATHSNGVAPPLIGGTLGKEMAAAGIAGDVGPPTGFVVTFSNGLVAYLSGDTGFTADQDLVVHGYYHAKLAVMNIGDVYTTGPKEAAYVIDQMVRPASVIPSHANEAATQGGKVLAGTRTETFLKAVKVPAYVPLSGRTMGFDNAGKCVEGC